MNVEERFWGKVQKTEGCWLWLACQSGDYGQFSYNGGRIKAHRMAWMLSYDQIPKGMKVCHHCDNKLCVNPEHLYLGTQKANIRDMMIKGRSPTVGALQQGVLNRNAKLTEEEALSIYNSPLSPKVLATLYPVGLSQIYNIRNGYRWTFGV